MKRIWKTITNSLGIASPRVSRSRLERLFPEATKQELDTVEFVRPFTMTSRERVWALMRAARYIVTKKLEGDFVECGVWRGGSCMAAALALMELGDTGRRLWLYDTYAGMSRPTERDVSIKTQEGALEKWEATQSGADSAAWCDTPIDIVRKNLALTGYPMDRLRFVKGKVEETLRVPEDLPERIALLRLDTDWYESTKAEMEVLFPRVVTGGVVILDDYGHWAGTKQAVDEYFEKMGSVYLLNRIDRAGRMFLKI